MKVTYFSILSSLLAGTTLVVPAATPLLSVGDSIIAIDTDPSENDSNFPGGEPPTAAIDGDPGTKYLNFGRTGTGLIVTTGSSIAKSLTVTTGGDAEGRDPTSYQVYGTNDAITSANNSDGLAESWTLLDTGSLSLPSDRNTAGAAVNLTNSSAYSSYKIVFPTMKDISQNSIQFSEIQFYDGPDATGNALFTPTNPVVAIDQPGFPSSRYPGGESPGNLLDGDGASKYLNFGGINSGFIVEPSILGSTVTALEVWTANDASGRDPAAFEIYGALGAMLSDDNSLGNQEAWTLIAADSLSLPEERMASGGLVPIAGADPYDIYKVVFTDLKNPNDIFQISEFQLYTGVVPEPTTTATLAMSFGLLALRRRRQS
ncbi:PEP-CTERM sorting domain-containing protein [Roseibacillus persicicus]|uniref:PEP-CTERM sorting domain-containing protein n=1 Tax=Roseibacillus persicicus TaxID=454148 RepID=UPI00398B99B8